MLVSKVLFWQLPFGLPSPGRGYDAASSLLDLAGPRARPLFIGLPVMGASNQHQETAQGCNGNWLIQRNFS